MIVRIMGEGQFEVPDSLVDRLNELDNAVLAALDSSDETDFRVSLAALLAAVRAGGTAVDHDTLVPSDATLPYDEATVDEVRALLREDGLIPG
ncbi:PspA-associated protein PspAA [Streptacidiphilus cavernicola]|uniref:PspA-associated domain-containing protein n=1 Tax=Streptacidiphilus cavernicola TaxID=3342716 RepID=A0ABV6VSN4_9ACTN